MDEPFFALKVGPLSCFCLYNEPLGFDRHQDINVTLTDEYRGRIPSAPQLQDSRRENPARVEAMPSISRESCVSGVARSIDEDAGREASGDSVAQSVSKPPPPRLTPKQPRLEKQNSATGKESLEWLNEIMRNVWPHMSKAVEKEVKGRVTDKIRSKLPSHLATGFEFRRFSLGSQVPKLGPVEVRLVSDIVSGGHRQGGIQLHLGIDYESDVDIYIHAMVVNVGIKSMRFTGEVVMRMMPLLEEQPVVGGVMVYFLDCPQIDFDLTGVADIADQPLISRVVRRAMADAVSDSLVLPNVISVPLGSEDQGVDLASLKCPAPIGVLRVKPLRATDLIGKDWHMFKDKTSDPFVRLVLGEDTWDSSVVKANCSPKWPDTDYFDFFIFDLHQKLRIEVFDANLIHSEQLIGRAPPMKVMTLFGFSGNDLSLSLDAEHPNAGKLALDFSFYELSSAAPAEEKACFLKVQFDEVWIPRSLAEAAALRVQIGKEVRTTKVATALEEKVVHSAVDETLIHIGQRCLERGMDPQVVEQLTGLTEGQLNEDEEHPKPDNKHDVDIELVIETAFYFRITAAQVASQEIKIQLMDKSSRKLAEHVLPLQSLTHEPEMHWCRYHKPLVIWKDEKTKKSAKVQVQVWLMTTMPGDIEHVIRSDAPKSRLNRAGRLSRTMAMPPSAGICMSPALSAGQGEVVGDLMWVNELFKLVWPFVRKAATRIASEMIEPEVHAKVPGFNFKAFDLGDETPEIGPVVISHSHGQYPMLEVRIVLDLVSDCHIEAAIGPVSVGVKSFKFGGLMVLRMEPLIEEIPVVGGIVAYFMDPPVLDLDFVGLANIADCPGIAGAVRSAMDSVIASTLVLPNVVAVPLGTEEQNVDRASLKAPAPSGVLASRVVSCTKLEGLDWHLFSAQTSDPYVTLKVGDQEWSSPVVKGTCDPVWGEDASHRFIVFDREQGLRAMVYDYDMLKKDDVIGCAKPMTVLSALEMSRSPMELFATNASGHEESRGMMTMDFQWLEAKRRVPGPYPHGAIVVVKVDEIFLPMLLGEDAALAVALNGVEKTTPVVKMQSTKVAADAVTQVLQEKAKMLKDLGEEEEAIAEILNVDMKTVECMLEELDDENDSLQTDHNTVLELPVEQTLYFSATQAQLDVGVVELQVMTGGKAVAATSVALKEVAADPSALGEYPGRGRGSHGRPKAMWFPVIRGDGKHARRIKVQVQVKVWKLEPTAAIGLPSDGKCREACPNRAQVDKELASVTPIGAVMPSHAQGPPGVENGCGQVVDPKKTGADDKDPIQEHYKKTGFLGAITGAFGDKKTMYCHHLTAGGLFAVREAERLGKEFASEEEVWAFVGKSGCCGRYAYDRSTHCLKCGPIAQKDHDRTCNEHTCLFIANGLECPIPDWAFK